MRKHTILIVGTYDTKNDELSYLAGRIRSLGGDAMTMDVSVLGDADQPCDVSKHDVAKAAGKSIQEVIDSGDENFAMQIMAKGAAICTVNLFEQSKFHGVICLGGTMGTDLALDVCQALPLDIPKYVVSTVAFSPLIPPNRLSPNIQMILWAGGLYGLNSICKSSLSQAAGAVLGAAQAVEMPTGDKPVVGMTSLGLSCLKYMKHLKPELERRNFEVAVFHAVGMGGMAFEKIAAQRGFCCVMDFALPELGNLLAGSFVNAGDDRLLNAGKSAIPQIVAPGCIDLIDFAGWQEIPPQYSHRPFHAHNRLIKCSALTADERRETAREIGGRLVSAKGPVHFILPNQGVEEWDKPGEAAHDPEGLRAFNEEMKTSIKPPAQLTEIDAHINDQEFADAALRIFDHWLDIGIIAQTP